MRKMGFYQAYVLPLAFIMMGLGLVLKPDVVPIMSVVGWVNLLFWSFLLLFRIYQNNIHKT